jgi:hypothetical protein
MYYISLLKFRVSHSTFIKIINMDGNHSEKKCKNSEDEKTVAYSK